MRWLTQGFYPIIFAASLNAPVVSAMPIGLDPTEGPATSRLVETVQLGNGGPIGGGANGAGAGTGAPSVLNPNAAGTRGPGGLKGAGSNSPAAGRPNGSKPAPMMPNGTRKVN